MIYYYWDLFNFLLCKLHDGLAFCRWENLLRRNVSLASSGNAQYPGDASCLTFCFSSDYWAFAQTREVIFLSLTSSSTCNYVIVRLFPLRLRLNWLMTVDIQGFVLPVLFWARLSLGWATLATFWWQVARWAQEILGHRLSLLSYTVPQGIWGPEPTDSSANQGSTHGIKGQSWFVPAVTTVYLLHRWTRNKPCFVYKMKICICSIFWKHSILSVNGACKIRWNCIWKTWSHPEKTTMCQLGLERFRLRSDYVRTNHKF